MEIAKKVKAVKKPKCKLIGANSNIYNLVDIAAKTLRKADKAEAATEMRDKVLACDSYDKALCIISEYVDIY